MRGGLLPFEEKGRRTIPSSQKRSGRKKKRPNGTRSTSFSKPPPPGKGAEKEETPEKQPSIGRHKLSISSTPLEKEGCSQDLSSPEPNRRNGREKSCESKKEKADDQD